MRKSFICFLLTLQALSRCDSAPLFPEDAGDAVRILAEKGVLAGYRDGTFKGDRAMSRWELAMALARWLSLQSQNPASRADLSELRKLAQALQPELESLGVSLNGLEETASQLDQRVTELERISFYGSLQTRVAVQRFSNQGSALSDARNPLLNYQTFQLVGAGTAVDFNPNTFGVYSLADLKSGNLQVSGVGFTSLLTLGIKAKLDAQENWTAGAEFTAFSAQGSEGVNAYYGVSAPYLSNFFTAVNTVTGGAGVNPDNNQPYTRATLDHFWFHHAPSDTTLILGAFRNTTFDPLVYTPQINYNSGGPRYLDGYGFQLHGNQVELGADLILNYEVMGTRLADDNAGAPLLSGGLDSNPAGYFNHAEGFSAGLNFDQRRGLVRLNFLHAANEESGGGVQGIGLVSEFNQLTTINPWVNPNGYYVGQLGVGQKTAGIGSTSDVRPVPAAGTVDGSTAANSLATGNIGPQDQTSYGASVVYNFEGWLHPKVFGDWAQSFYKPQKNSAYSTSGGAGRVGVGFSVATVRLQAEYLDVAANYDPFVLQMPRINDQFYNLYHFPLLDYPANLYSLHDTATFPQNREGFRLKLEWEFAPKGLLEVRFGSLQQKQTSLQDIHYSAGSLGLLTPDVAVLGHSPGFVEPVFGAFAAQTFAPQGGNLLGLALENPRGTMENLEIRAEQKFANDPSGRGFTLLADYQASRFERGSSLQSLLPGPQGTIGEDINRVDLHYQALDLKLSYDFNESVSGKIGYDRLEMQGHYDPFGTYGPYAASTGQTHFDNLHVTQHEPFVGGGWQIADDLHFDGEFRLLMNIDHIASSVYPTPNQPGVNVLFTPQASAHPFNWGGYRLNTGLSWSF